MTEGKPVKKRGTVKNGRVIRLRGVSCARPARRPEGLESILDYGFKPAFAPSILHLIQLRLLVQDRLTLVRLDRIASREAQVARLAAIAV